MRPPATHDRVLAILCDGARPDVMMKMAAAGELPVVKQHFVDAGGLCATRLNPSMISRPSGAANNVIALSWPCAASERRTLVSAGASHSRSA